MCCCGCAAGLDPEECQPELCVHRAPDGQDPPAAVPSPAVVDPDVIDLTDSDLPSNGGGVYPLPVDIAALLNLTFNSTSTNQSYDEDASMKLGAKAVKGVEGSWRFYCYDSHRDARLLADSAQVQGGKGKVIDRREPDAAVAIDPRPATFVVSQNMPAPEQLLTELGEKYHRPVETDEFDLDLAKLAAMRGKVRHGLVQSTASGGTLTLEQQTEAIARELAAHADIHHSDADVDTEVFIPISAITSQWLLGSVDGLQAAMTLGLILASKHASVDDLLLKLIEANGPTDSWHRDGDKPSALKGLTRLTTGPLLAAYQRNGFVWAVVGKSYNKALAELYVTIGFGGGAPGSWTFKSAVSTKSEQFVTVFTNAIDVHRRGSKVVCTAPTSVIRRVEHRSIVRSEDKIMIELAAREEEYRGDGPFTLDQQSFAVLKDVLGRKIAGQRTGHLSFCAVCCG